MSWDHSVDFVVVGSGAAGMSGAMRAIDLGMETVILEASDRYGGSTAISGGVVWIPDNPQMNERGVADSREDVLHYLEQIVGKDVVSRDRLETYVDESVRVLEYFETRTHLHLDALEKYCDYYAELPGGKPGGRSMEPVPFDATQLGKEQFGLLRRSHPQSQVLGRFGMTARFAHTILLNGWSSTFRILGMVLRYAWRMLTKNRGYPRDTRICAGNAIAGRLRLSLMERDAQLWLNSPAKELIVEDGKVVGVLAEREGKPVRIEARKGVLLAAGGFERNQQMREQYMSGPQDTNWNVGNTYNVGEGIKMGEAVGGTLHLMEETWGTPVTRFPKSANSWVLVIEKSLPGSIMVNKHGKRFMNEAAPYLDNAREMYAHDAVPVCWLLFDAEFRHRYPVGPVAPGYAMKDSTLPRRLREGWFRIRPTIRELAEAIELDPDALEATVARFNEQAARGVDEDFGRGNNPVDRYYADPRVGSNPSLRPLTKPPFYAIPCFPGDLGTKGGLLTDAGARVLREDGSVIEGLYAAGNTSAAVMGLSYPGAGGTIGPALVFGFLAAEAAAADTSSQESIATEEIAS